MEALRKERRYTYADYLTWDGDTRYELIDGVPYAFAAPNVRHQEVCGELFGQLRDFLKGKLCKVFIAPIDVRLNPQNADDTVVQADVIVVCDHSKIGGNSINGAPDLVIEVLSPSTASYDLIVKLNRYRESGVREYWVIDPENNAVQVFIFNGDKNNGCIINTYESECKSIPMNILDGCVIDLREIFKE
ncbi:MAG: Uma2 family endonuclease [Oscillospiraceae bacterium]|nr:Uma2 family endonuclease [Oscillospiraceae bacterium]